jgi:hypothetical protein
MDVVAENRGLMEDENVKMADMSRELENTLLYEEFIGDKNQEHYGLRRGIAILDFFIRWPILIPGITG